jgi:hypothetical protein
MKYNTVYKHTAVHVFRELVLEEVGERLNSRGCEGVRSCSLFSQP